MLQIALTLMQWLPRLFIWLVVPIASVSLLLAMMRRSRAHAALGFMIAASASAILLAIETVAIGYICCDQARMLLSILLDFRPGVTLGFALSLFGNIVKPLAGVLPMLAGAAATGVGAYLLRHQPSTGTVSANQPLVSQEAETA